MHFLTRKFLSGYRYNFKVDHGHKANMNWISSLRVVSGYWLIINESLISVQLIIILILSNCMDSFHEL